jgi:hypothetical protein
MALAAFIIASAVYLLAPPTGPLVTLLLAQVSSAIIFTMLAFPLGMAQVGMDPIHNVEIRPVTNLETLGRLLLVAIPMLVLWDGTTAIFYHTHCEDLTILSDARRCMNGEALLGAHGPFSNIYYAAYFGIMAFAPPVFTAFQALRRRTKRLDNKQEMPEDAID